MTNLKKLLILFAMLFITFGGFSQGASPVQVLKIADLTTAFGSNISVGTEIYCISNKAVYKCFTATASTGTLTTSSANFKIISNYVSATGTLSSGDSVAVFNRTTQQYETKKITFGTGNGTLTGITPGLGITVNPSAAPSPTVNVDTANASILSRQRAVNTYLPKALANTNIYVGNSSGVGTAVAVSQDATLAADGKLTVVSSNADFKVKGKLTVVGSVDDNAPDSVVTLVAGEQRRASMASLATALGTSLAIKTAIAQSFEKATADSAAGYAVRLSNTPVAGTISVSLNGADLPSSKFSVVSTSKIFVSLPAYQYDKYVVKYSY
jgi:hypothetical protein